MRVSTNQHLGQWLTELQRNTARLQRQEIAVASGRAVNNLSDNPGAIRHILGLRGQLGTQEKFVSAIDDTLDWLNATDAALQRVTNLLGRAQEIATQGATGTLVQADRKVLMSLVDELINQLVDITNTKFNGKYLFAGSKTQGTAPFSIDKENFALTFVGDNQAIEREVQTGSTITINTPGNFFGAANGANPFDPVEPGFDSSIFGVLIELRTALDTGTDQDVRGLLDKIGSAFEKSLAEQAKVGAKVNRLESLKDLHETLQLHLESVLSEVETVDMVKAVMNLKKEETAYQAALQVGAKIMQVSLLDYLK